MEITVSKKRFQQKVRARRTRARLRAHTTLPRLSVFRSGKHIYAQIIDDQTGKTIVSAHDLGLKGKKDVSSAESVGKLVAERAGEKKITKVVFDRGGYKYHGKIKTLADAARKAGLQF